MIHPTILILFLLQACIVSLTLASYCHYPHLIPEMQTNTVTGLDPAAVSDVGACGGGLPGDTGQSAILDCSSGVVRCSGEGRATDYCHGSQNIGPSEVRATSRAKLGRPLFLVLV